MRTVVRTLVFLLALLGAGVLLVAGWGWLNRKDLADRALRQALTDFGLKVSQLEVKSLDVGSSKFGPVELVWHDQRLRLESAELSFASVLPLKGGQLDLRGLSVVLDPRSLPPVVEASAPANNPATESWPLPPLDRLRGDVAFSLGKSDWVSEPISVHFDFVGRGPEVQGTAVTRSDRSQAEFAATYAPEKKQVNFGWRDAKLNLTELHERVRRFDSTLLPALNLEGTVVLDGALKYEEGTWSGHNRLVLQQGAAAWPEKKVSAEGIQFEVQANLQYPNWDLSTVRVLKVAKIKVADITVEDLELAFAMDSSGEARVLSLQARAFGGRLSLSPFSTQLAAWKVRSRLKLENVDLNAIAGLFGEIGAQVAGRGSGELELTVAPGQLTFHGGRFTLDGATPATLQLQQKGLLTGGMDTKSLLYPTLLKIENGILHLSLDSLEAGVLEEGGPDDVSAVVKVSGHPTDPQLRSPVNLTVNVRGPLATLLRHALNQRLSFGTSSP